MQAVDNTLPFADQVVFPSEVGNISCLMPSLTHVKIHKILQSEDSISPLRLSFILLFFPHKVSDSSSTQLPCQSFLGENAKVRVRIT